MNTHTENELKMNVTTTREKRRNENKSINKFPEIEATATKGNGFAFVYTSLLNVLFITRCERIYATILFFSRLFQKLLFRQCSCNFYL